MSGYARKAKFCNHRRCFVELNYCIFSEFLSNAPKTKRKGYRQNESPNVKTKAEQSFCYAPTGKSGCILSMQFFSENLSREWRRKKHACIIHIPGCICRFALGFCKNIKKRTETLYQSFSPFMLFLGCFLIIWHHSLKCLVLLMILAYNYIHKSRLILSFSLGYSKIWS